MHSKNRVSDVLAGGFSIDPIERISVFHYYPGTRTLTIGSQTRDDWSEGPPAPETLAQAARHLGCASVAFTDDDPAIAGELALRTVYACHGRDVQAVAVCTGDIAATARRGLFTVIDAASVDLRPFRAPVYQRQCDGDPGEALSAIEGIVKESRCWLELSSLLIPERNDSDEAIEALCRWVASRLGPDVPVHFSSVAGDAGVLRRARLLAKAIGIHHVYAPNGIDVETASTNCSACDTLLVERRGDVMTRLALENGHCPMCKTPLPGRFATTPSSVLARGNHTAMLHCS